jgi:O-antigen ligase
VTDRILVALTFLALFTPLIHHSAFAYPFVTPKHLFFRIVVEIGLIAGMASALIGRVRLGLIGWAILATCAASVISAFFGVAPYQSFISNGERLGGIVTQFHLVVFFLMTMAVARRPGVERRLLHVSVLVAGVAAIGALIQAAGFSSGAMPDGRVGGALENPSFLAAYLLLAIGLTAWLFATASWRAEKFHLVVMAALQLSAFALARSRGAALGLAVGLAVGLVLHLLLQGGRARRAAGLIIVVIALCAVALLPLARSIAVSSPDELAAIDRTAASRVMLWRVAVQAWREYPLFGWGPENFIVAANRFSTPVANLDEWYDRAHNVFLDRLAATGIVGFVAWLSIFGAGLWIMHGPGRARFTPSERSIGTGVLAAYLGQGLFSFDDLTIQITMMTIFGIVAARVADDPAVARMARPPMTVAGGFRTLLVAASAVVMLISLHHFVYRPAVAAAAFMKTNRIAPAEEALGYFQRVFENDASISLEAAKNLLDRAPELVGDPRSDEGRRRAAMILDWAEGESGRRRGLDAALTMRIGGFQAFLGDQAAAERSLAEARRLAPARIEVVALMALFALHQGDTERATSLAREAYALSPRHRTARQTLALLLLESGQEAEAWRLINSPGEWILDERFAEHYLRRGRSRAAAKIFGLLADHRPDEPLLRWREAEAWRAGDRPERAITALEKAARCAPELRPRVAAMIAEIRAESDTRLPYYQP